VAEYARDGHYNLVHDAELTRLRAEIDALQRVHSQGINGMLQRLTARVRKRFKPQAD
jgi:hypothetical protein